MRKNPLDKELQKHCTLLAAKQATLKAQAEAQDRLDLQNTASQLSAEEISERWEEWHALLDSL